MSDDDKGGVSNDDKGGVSNDDKGGVSDDDKGGVSDDDKGGVSDDDKGGVPRPMTRPPAMVDPGRYDGPARSAPYPLSRMAPSYDLVDAAASIQAADQTLATMTGGKLALIADQIRALQAKARELLDKAKRDAELHRVSCSFEKKPGGVYHLYRRVDGVLWFSRIAPHEWVTTQTETFEGSYQLELDQSFTRVD